MTTNLIRQILLWNAHLMLGINHASFGGNDFDFLGELWEDVLSFFHSTMTVNDVSRWVTVVDETCFDFMLAILKFQWTSPRKKNQEHQQH